MKCKRCGTGKGHIEDYEIVPLAGGTFNERPTLPLCLFCNHAAQDALSGRRVTVRLARVQTHR
jgi:hypothetical protein